MLWTLEQARAIDQLTSETYAVPAIELMAAAGHAVACEVLRLRRTGQPVLVLAGPGNNGGDALVAARILHHYGHGPRVLSVMEDPARESPLRREQRLRAEAIGLPMVTVDPTKLRRERVNGTLVVDGILGLGVKAPLRPGLARDTLDAVRQGGPETVLAIDLPSGLDADVWQCEAPPLPATHTLTFGAPKPVHVFAPARQYIGELRCEPLGFHPDAIRHACSNGPHLLHNPFWPSAWLHLPADAHKYTRGHVLVIGGSPGKLGAPLLAASAAFRTGAGWSSVALLSQEQQAALPAHLTYEAFAATGRLQADAFERFLDERRVKSVLIGPGTMENPLDTCIIKILQRWNRERGLFVVFDAGALRGLGPKLRDHPFVPERTLVTPHPGEWRTLEEGNRDLGSLEALETAWSFCAAAGVTVFYKSASPFALWPGRYLASSTTGDERLAKAGSGDILAGVALSLGTSGLSAAAAACQAQAIVARASQAASRLHGRHGVIPDDLLLQLGAALEASG